MTEAIDRAELYAAKNLSKYIKTLERMALGIWVEKETPDGQNIVYQLPPDRGANEYLISRAMGKPTQRTEIVGDEGGPVEIMPWLPSTAVPALAEPSVEEDGSETS